MLEPPRRLGYDSDTPPPKGTAMTSPVADQIKKDISENDVVLYMKGTPVQPMCGFSAMAVQILSHMGVKFKGVNVLEDPALRQGVKEFANWPTIPQLYIKGEFVGGCDIMREMYESGELEELMKSKAVKVNA
jgi:monothiol glutaredoxin